MCRSQAPFCLCTLRAISDRAEGTFGRLRYFLGGDRPSQTVHLTMSRDQIHGRRLEFQYCQGGIPRLTPLRLTPKLLSLPPILYRQYRNSMLSYSKALRGLSVQSRVARDRKSTRLNSSHANISYAVFCLKKKKHRIYI